MKFLISILLLGVLSFNVFGMSARSPSKDITHLRHLNKLVSATMLTVIGITIVNEQIALGIDSDVVGKILSQQFAHHDRLFDKYHTVTEYDKEELAYNTFFNDFMSLAIVLTPPELPEHVAMNEMIFRKLLEMTQDNIPYISSQVQGAVSSELQQLKSINGDYDGFRLASKKEGDEFLEHQTLLMKNVADMSKKYTPKLSHARDVIENDPQLLKSIADLQEEVGFKNLATVHMAIETVNSTMTLIKFFSDEKITLEISTSAGETILENLRVGVGDSVDMLIPTVKLDDAHKKLLTDYLTDNILVSEFVQEYKKLLNTHRDLINDEKYAKANAALNAIDKG